MKKLFILILPFLAQAAFAQIDSLVHVADSTVSHKLDSIERSFMGQADNLKQSYGQPKSKIERLKGSYQHKIDSLTSLKLPTDKYSQKIDSLNNEAARIQQKVTAKIDSLKNRYSQNLKSLNLPPQAQDRASKFTSSFDDLNLPSIDTEISDKIVLPNLDGSTPGLPAEFKTDGMPSVNSSNINLPSVNTPSIERVQGEFDQLNQMSDKAGEIQQQINEGISVEKTEQVIENNVAQLDQIKELQKQNLPVQVPADGDQAKKQLAEMAKKEAVNHFAGKEAALQQAMEKMSKYKQKYNSLSSIKDLPEKAPNPLKEKPFIERIVPGITLQFQSFHYFSLDVNVSAGYKFTQRIVAGLGWNQRWAFDGSDFVPSARIFGVRSYGEFHFKKGFALRADLECMNTQVKPVTQTAETTHREWVWSAFSGVKQEYRIAKNLRGNVQLLYNLFDPHYKSPYTDRLNYRMGFEYVIKKKQKQNGN